MITASLLFFATSFIPKNYVETIPESDAALDMIFIPGGTFQMGSPPKEKGRRADEGPQHTVTVAPFWMSKTEMTWEAYAAFLDVGLMQALSGEADSGPDALTYPTPPYEDETFGYGKKNQPAIALTQHAVLEYTRWISKTTGKTYRLPTEAEWEYACRAGTKTAYSFGNSPKALGEHAWFIGNAAKKPRPVGVKKPNPFGLLDMHGNTAEWVIDQYDPKFYAQAQIAFPVNIPGNRRVPHVVRGGGWRDTPEELRCAARQFSKKIWNRQDPQNPQSIWWHTEPTDVGFRLVRPVEEHESLKGFRSKLTRESSY
jgi:formylglycine-generating enzyme required for sulfatase activity